MKKLCISFFVLAQFISSQVKDERFFIPQDTSFTVYSTYQKELKKFPFIKIAQPKLNNELSVDSNLVYVSYGKRSLHLDIFYYKDRTQSYPAVMLVHGGGWRSGDKSQQIPMAQEIAASGFVTVTVEYRLSPEAKYPAAILDIKTAVRWIRANASIYNIDTNRIAVLGCSAGGHLASMLGVTEGVKKFEDDVDNFNCSSRVQAVINIDGILDFTNPAESGKDQDSKKPSVGMLWLGFSFQQNPEIWKEASPINYENLYIPPFLFINSSADRFHAGQDVFIEKLRKNKAYYEIHTFPDTPHSFWFFHPWFKSVNKIAIEFLRKIFS